LILAVFVDYDKSSRFNSSKFLIITYNKQRRGNFREGEMRKLTWLILDVC